MPYGDIWSGEAFDWDKDPRIVDPAISRLSDAYLHHRTGAILLCYSVRGQWTDRALREMRSCFRTALPERHLFRVHQIGLLRLSIDLGRYRSPNGPGMGPEQLFDSVDETFAASSWAFDRAVRAQTGRRRDVPDEPPVIRILPGTEEADVFRAAESDIGPNVAPDRQRGRGPDWSDLREVTYLDIRSRLYSW